MKASNFLAANATIKQLQKEILLSTKGQYIRESNILAINATIKQLEREVLQDTKGQFMKDSKFITDIVTNNLLIG